MGESAHIFKRTILLRRMSCTDNRRINYVFAVSVMKYSICVTDINLSEWKLRYPLKCTLLIQSSPLNTYIIIHVYAYIYTCVSLFGIIVDFDHLPFWTVNPVATFFHHGYVDTCRPFNIINQILFTNLDIYLHKHYQLKHPTRELIDWLSKLVITTSSPYWTNPILWSHLAWEVTRKSLYKLLTTS